MQFKVTKSPNGWKKIESPVGVSIIKDPKDPDTLIIEVDGFNPMSDIEEFHRKFGLLYEGVPRSLPEDVSRFRTGFMSEEMVEYMEAQEAAADERTKAPAHRDAAEYTHQLEKAMDGLVDLVYVVLGTSHLHGFNFIEGWQRVHEANMMKMRAQSADQSKRNSTHDVVKPLGWEPPVLTDLVEVNNLLHADDV